jgi:hypothetical protein
LWNRIIFIFADQFNGAIAQLVEQRTENPCVAGSIPAGTTKSLTQVGLFFGWIPNVHITKHKDDIHKRNATYCRATQEATSHGIWFGTSNLIHVQKPLNWSRNLRKLNPAWGL